MELEICPKGHSKARKIKTLPEICNKRVAKRRIVLRAGLEPESSVHLTSSGFLSRYWIASCGKPLRQGDAARCGKISAIWHIIGKSEPVFCGQAIEQSMPFIQSGLVRDLSWLIKNFKLAENLF